jgi:hypothetical protein
MSGGVASSVPKVNLSGAGTLLGNPLVQKQVLNAKINKFSGNRADWAGWSREWQEYLEILCLAGELTEASKMWALIENVDSATAQFWKQRKSGGEILTYQGLWRELCKEQNKGREQQLRKEWDELKLRSGGKLVRQEWRVFLAALKRLSEELGYFRESEKAEKILRQLPKHLLTKAIAQHTKQNSKSFLVAGLNNMDENGVREFFTGQKIAVKTVERFSPSQWIVVLEDGTGVAKIANLEGSAVVIQYSDGTELTSIFRANEAGEGWTVKEVVEVVDQDLNIQEEQDLFTAAGERKIQRVDFELSTEKEINKVGVKGGSKGSEELWCHRCNQQGHISWDCSAPRVCYRCEKTGHEQSVCPLRIFSWCGGKGNSGR